MYKTDEITLGPESENEDVNVVDPVLPPLSSVDKAVGIGDTEHLLRVNTEFLIKVQAELRMEQQPYKDHCYASLIKGLVCY